MKCEARIGVPAPLSSTTRRRTMSPHRSRAMRLAIASVVVLGLVGCFVALRWYPRGQVGYLFDLKDVPWSVRSARCKSINTSVTLLTCAFRVDANDFPKLLVSERFSQAPIEFRHAHDFPMALDLGDDFVPEFHYFAVPKDAEHGGALDVFADASKTMVLAHLYIE